MSGVRLCVCEWAFGGGSQCALCVHTIIQIGFAFTLAAHGMWRWPSMSCKNVRLASILIARKARRCAENSNCFRRSTSIAIRLYSKCCQTSPISMSISIRFDQLIDDIVWSNRRTYSFFTQAPYNQLIKARTASLALALPVSDSSKQHSVYADRHGLTCHHWASVINVFASVKRSIYSYESILPSGACIWPFHACALLKRQQQRK